VSDFDKIGNAMTMAKQVKKPILKKDQMPIRVLACSLAPGDVIMIQGNLVFLHPGKFPFVP
jgi:NADPH:quinone reductase-like Zn-dependent oxidoreductase